jgi:NAD(P)-dependent dehydrogenase (short-subunit alcohol dehydrogenase family)
MSLLNNPFDTTREAALVTGAGAASGRAIAQALVGEKEYAPCSPT